MIIYSMQENKTRNMFIRRSLYHIIIMAVLTCSFGTYSSENNEALYSDLLPEKKTQTKILFHLKPLHSANVLNT